MSLGARYVMHFGIGPKRYSYELADFETGVRRTVLRSPSKMGHRYPKRVMRWFARMPPLLFLGFYLAAIPFYAAGYTSMKTQFYQSTSHFDATFRVSRDMCERSLAEFYRPWLAHYLSGRYRLKSNSVYVDRIEF